MLPACDHNMRRRLQHLLRSLCHRLEVCYGTATDRNRLSKPFHQFFDPLPKTCKLVCCLSIQDIKAEGVAEPGGLLNYLQSFAGSQCTDPRDKVFALYGISTLPGQQELSAAFIADDLKPAYDKDVGQLYASAARQCLQSGDLAILSKSMVRRSKALSLPSWVPDWTAFDRSESFASLAATGEYNASKSAVARPLFPSLSTCGLEGNFVSTAEHVLKLPKVYATYFKLPYTPEPRAFISTREPVSHGLLEERTKCFPSDIYVHTKEPIPDVCFAGMAALLHSYQSQWSRQRFQAMTRNYAHDEESLKLVRDYYKKYKSYLESGRVIAQWVHMARAAVRVMRSIFKIGSPYADQMMRERVVFVSDKNHLGIGPCDLTKGDRVAILKGSRVPLILRPQKMEEGECFTVLGDAYVHGMMQGEAYNEDQCVPITLI